MNVVLFEDKATWENLLPFTYTRPTADIRVGILKISDKWRKHLNADISYVTEEYLSDKYSLHLAKQNLYINGSVCPSVELVAALQALKHKEVLRKGELVIAHFDAYIDSAKACHTVDFPFEVVVIQQKHDIFVHNGNEIKKDYVLLTAGRTSQPITDKHTIVYGEENVFLEEGVKIKAAILNAEGGPIYIGKDAEIKEGAIVRGPFAMLEHSMLNLGAKIQGDTTIGPYSKIGGEVSNSVIFGYSNKVHDGFIGNTVLGEWCNLGADTNTSNLKNNYSEVKVWSYATSDYVNTKRQFHGLMMGDYSKAGINTMFNTGTVVGVSANIFGAGFPPKFIPSFTWGGAEGMQTFKFEQAIEAAQKVYARRGLVMDAATQEILKTVFQEEGVNRQMVHNDKKRVQIVHDTFKDLESFQPKKDDAG